MFSIIENAPLRESLVKNGLQFAYKFDWETLGPEYLDLYHRAIKDHKERVFYPWSELTSNLWLELKK